MLIDAPIRHNRNRYGKEVCAVLSGGYVPDISAYPLIAGRQGVNP
jgi:hypothetical protein